MVAGVGYASLSDVIGAGRTLGEMMAEARKNTGARLLPSTIAELDAAGERMGGKSRAFVIEVLVALHARQLNGKTQIPVDMVPSDARAKRKPKEEPADPPKKRGRPKKPGKPTA